MLRFACVVVMLMSLPAVADDANKIEVALAANAPWGWVDGESVGASAYVGFREHFAIRVNAMSHAFGLVDQHIGEAGYDGRITDIGAGLQWHPQRLFDGPLLELGYVRRSLDTSTYDDYAPVPYVAEDQVGHAARAFAGWSVRSGRIFAQLAVGASYGRYTGTETMSMDHFDDESDRRTRGVNRFKVAPEMYFRFGIALGR